MDLPKRVAETIDHFTGRAWLLPKLLAWWDHRADRLCLLTGGPGTGKSMILAWLAGGGPAPEEAEARGQLERLRSLVKALHFCLAASGSTDPKELARQLAGQLTRKVAGFGKALAATMGDQVHIASEQHIDRVEKGGSVTGVYIANLNLGGLSEELSFNRILRDPLKRLYADGYDQPMLLLVDALDEALTYTGGTNLVQLLAKLTDLPAPVRLLVTTRDDPRVLKFFPSVTRCDLIRDADPAVDDVRSYAAGRLATLAAIPEGPRAAFAQRLAEQAKGVFLYAALVLDELPTQPSTVLPDLDTYPLPDGLTGLYHGFLTRELGQDEARWFALYEPLLGLIAVAQGDGLTAPQLTALIGTDIRLALRASKQYLTGELPDGPFRPFHRSFAEFLLEEEGNTDYHIDAAEMHGRVARHFQEKYGGDWLQCPDAYALAYQPSHLMFVLCAKQSEEAADALCGLLTDLRFLERKAGVMGVFAALGDVAAARHALGGSAPRANVANLGEVLAALDGESHHLREWDPEPRPAMFVQQILLRATRLGMPGLATQASRNLTERGHSHLVERWGSGHPSEGVVRTLAGHVGRVWSVAVTADGERVISGGDDGTVRVWKLATGEEVVTLVGHKGRVRAVAAMADGGRVISAGADGMVRVWDPATGRAVTDLAGHGCEVLSLVCIPGSLQIVSGDEKGFIRSWDLSDGSSRPFRAHAGEIRSLAPIPNSEQFVSASSDRRARIWNTAGTQIGVDLESEVGTLRAVCVSPEGCRAYCAASDGTVKSWPLKPNGESKSQPADRQYTGHRGRVRSVAVTADGKYVISGAEDRLLKVWDAAAPSGVMPVVTAQGHSGTLWTLAAVPRSSLFVCGSEDGAIKVWDLARLLRSPAASNSYNDQLPGHGGRVRAVVASKAGSAVLSGAQDGTIKYWTISAPPSAQDRVSVKCLDFPAHASEVTALAMGSSSRIALSGSRDKTVKVWDLVTNSERQCLKGHRKAITCVQLGPDEGTVVSAAEDGTLIVSSIGGKASVVLEGHRARVLAMALEPRMNCLISGAADGSVALWSAALPESAESHVRKPLWTSREHSKAVLDVAVSGSGQLAVTAGADGLLKVWALVIQQPPRRECPSMRLVCSLAGHEGPVLRVALTSNHAWAISISSDGTVRAWNLSAVDLAANAAGGPSSVLVGRTRRAIALVVLGGKDRFATISGEGRLEVWGIGSESGLPRRVLHSIASVSLEHELTCLAAASDGGSFFVGDRVGDIACFDLVDPLP